MRSWLEFYSPAWFSNEVLFWLFSVLVLFGVVAFTIMGSGYILQDLLVLFHLHYPKWQKFSLR